MSGIGQAHLWKRIGQTMSGIGQAPHRGRWRWCLSFKWTASRLRLRCMARHGIDGRRCFVVAIAMLGACATTTYGATDANLAMARSAAPEGAASFRQHCAGCHGERGESATGAPHVLGAGALPEYPRERNLNASPASGDPEYLRLQAQKRPLGAPWRDPFRTARDLYGYVSQHMPLPKERVGSLSAEEYWAIINFMLVAHGVEVPAEGVTAKNAGSVKL